MKTTLTVLTALVILLAIGCKKDKKQEPAPNNPTPPDNTEEVITTFELHLHDSTTHQNYTYIFEDIDGDGGQAAYYGNSGLDSTFTLIAGRKYGCEIILLDKTKTPIDTISNEVEEESKDHMLFFNNGNNSILNSNVPYSVTLNNTNINIQYLDIDNGTPQHSLGLTSVWTCPLTGTSGNKYPIKIELRHQPDAKNGTYAPGETDIEVTFKVAIQ